MKESKRDVFEADVHSIEANKTMAHAVANEVGGNFALNYFSFVDPDCGFIFFSIPGVANVRTIGSLQYAVAKARGVDFEIKSIKPIYNRKEGLIGNPKTHGFETFGKMLDDPGVIRFAFLRDPADRFAALYRNLLSINTKRTKPRERVFEFLNLSLDENLSALDLAELVIEEPGLKTASPHLRSQRQMAAFDLVDYSFIGRHERWEQGFSDVALEIFGEEVTPFNPVGVIAADIEGLAVKPLISNDVREAIRLAYAEDYEMLEEVDELFPDGFAVE